MENPRKSGNSTMSGGTRKKSVGVTQKTNYGHKKAISDFIVDKSNVGINANNKSKIIKDKIHDSIIIPNSNA